MKKKSTPSLGDIPPKKRNFLKGLSLFDFLFPSGEECRGWVIRFALFSLSLRLYA